MIPYLSLLIFHKHYTVIARNARSKLSISNKDIVFQIRTKRFKADVNRTVFRNLKPDTMYVVQVRPLYKGREGKFGIIQGKTGPLIEEKLDFRVFFYLSGLFSAIDHE